MTACIIVVTYLGYTYSFPQGSVIVPPFPSITTSTVVPKFSNSASSKLGIENFTSPAAVRVVDVLVISIGDCWVLVEQAMLSGLRFCQFVGPTAPM